MAVETMKKEVEVRVINPTDLPKSYLDFAKDLAVEDLRTQLLRQMGVEYTPNWSPERKNPDFYKDVPVSGERDRRERNPQYDAQDLKEIEEEMVDRLKDPAEAEREKGQVPRRKGAA